MPFTLKLFLSRCRLWVFAWITWIILLNHLYLLKIKCIIYRIPLLVMRATKLISNRIKIPLRIKKFL